MNLPVLKVSAPGESWQETQMNEKYSLKNALKPTPPHPYSEALSESALGDNLQAAYKLLRLAGVWLPQEVERIYLAQEVADFYIYGLSPLENQEKMDDILRRCVPMALLYSLAATCGEARFANDSVKKSRKHNPLVQVMLSYYGYQHTKGSRVGASALLLRAAQYLVQRGVSLVDISRYIVDIFLASGWTGGYGGKAWARCANLIVRYIDSGATLNPASPSYRTPKNREAMIVFFDQFVQAVHNGGPFSNKFSNMIISTNLISTLDCQRNSPDGSGLMEYCSHEAYMWYRTHWLKMQGFLAVTYHTQEEDES